MKKLLTLCAAVLASVSMWAASPYSLDITSYSWGGSGNKTANDGTITIGAYIQSKTYNNSSSTAVAYISGQNYLTVSATSACITSISLTGNTDDNSKTVLLSYQTSENGSVWSDAIEMTNAFSNRKSTPTNDAVNFETAVRYVRFVKSSSNYVSIGAITVTYGSEQGGGEQGGGEQGGGEEPTPVASVTIEGPADAYIGVPVTFTANTDVTANAYKWYVDGDEQNGKTAKTFEFTPTAKGTYSIKAAAKNDDNTTGYVESTAHSLTVTKVCGELISYTAATGSKAIDKDFTTTDGVIGGSGHQKTQSNAKINGGGYYSLRLASGSFIAGDTVSIYVTPENNAVPTELILASDQANTDIIGRVSGLTVDNTNPAQITLTKGASVIYLSRDGTVSAQNPIVTKISVSRSCEESDNADLAELTINGEAVEAVENVYSYTVAATVDLAQVAVAFSIAHPLASADKESPFNITVPAGGAAANTATITVTAENGDQVIYTVSVTKAAAASTDATLKSLKIDGVDVVDFAADKLTYGKEYEYDYALVPVISAEANDAPQATVEIDQAEAVPGVATITVTAEDKETKQVYTVNLTKEAVAPIIRATSTGNTTATVSGTIGGSYEKSTQGNKFGGEGNYWGLTLDGESTFQTGDTLHVIISQAAQQGTIALYEDKDGATLIYNTEALGVVGDNVFVFPAAMNGKKTFYICRTKTNSWNAFVSSICVKRKPAATAIGNTEAEVKAVKVIRDGQVLIIREGKTFNVMGAEVK